MSQPGHMLRRLMFSYGLWEHRCNMDLLYRDFSAFPQRHNMGVGGGQNHVRNTSYNSSLMVQ